MGAFTKADLILSIRNRATLSHLPRHTVEGLLDAVLEEVVLALAAHHRVELRGFATLAPHLVAARKGRNPKTGEAVEIPPKWRVKFRPGKEFKAALEEEID